MKVTPIFFLCAAAAFAGDFTTGQAARLVIDSRHYRPGFNSSDTIVGG
jgi:hypothetical protein